MALADLPWEPGDRLLLSGWEHHALHRPALKLAAQGVETVVVPPSTTAPVDLEVLEGALPDDLNGTYLRNTENPLLLPIARYHPFDGDGMLHAVYIEDGAARYRNRWIESKGLLAERARGRACYGGMANFTFPDDDVMQEGGMMKNTANTATVRHAGRYFSLMEAALPTEFDRDLRTLGECDFDGRLDGPFSGTRDDKNHVVAAGPAATVDDLLDDG